MNSWKFYLLMSIGLILSIACILFMAEFVRRVDFSDLEYTIENWPTLLASFMSGLIGFPLVISQLKKFSA